MSKGVKTLISIGVALAIPYVAPIIASSTALAGVAATLGPTATSALVGAGLGAAGAAITGQDVGRGALMGGIGGGIGGYAAAPSGAAAAAPTSAADAAFLEANLGAMAPGAGMPVTAAPTLAAVAETPELAYGATPTGTVGLDTSGLAGATAPAPVQAGLSTATAPAATAAGKTPTFTEALKQVPGQIAAKFKDPKALADLTLRAAGQIAGSALAGSGLSPEEEALLASQRQDLENLRQTNQQLFQQKLDQAQALLGEARYFNPNYFRQQAETAAKINIGRQQQAATRGQTGAQREFTERQYQLGAARVAPTAGLQAAGQAQQARLQTMQAGLSQIPTSGPTVDYSRLMAGYETADARRRKDQALIGELFGGLTGSQKSKSTGGG